MREGRRGKERIKFYKVITQEYSIKRMHYSILSSEAKHKGQRINLFIVIQEPIENDNIEFYSTNYIACI